MEIKILSSNSVFKDQLLAEHGLSIWFKYHKNEYLFDTGQGKVLKNNADLLNIDFNNLKGVILSHNHYDHTGGLKDLLKLKPELEIFGHPKTVQKLKENKFNLNPITENQKLEAGLWLTGQLSAADFNIAKDHKYLEQIKTENTLYAETDKGLVILLGCSHAGLINILEYIETKTKKNIHAVIGGMHLINKDKTELDKIIVRLKEFEIDLFYPLHCTGDQAVFKLKEAFTEQVKILHVGDKIEI